MNMNNSYLPLNDFLAPQIPEEKPAVTEGTTTTGPKNPTSGETGEQKNYSVLISNLQMSQKTLDQKDFGESGRGKLPLSESKSVEQVMRESERIQLNKSIKGKLKTE